MSTIVESRVERPIDRFLNLSALPGGWRCMRAKYFLHEVDERSEDGSEELLSVSHITGVTRRSEKNVTMFKAESYAGHKLCRPGDVVINTMWAWMAALGVSSEPGIVSPSYGVYRPRRASDFDPDYLDHLLRTREYVAEYYRRSTGIRSSRLRLYPDKFLDIRLVCPPIGKQRAIGGCIRAVDDAISDAIRNKRREINLLSECGDTIVNTCVTTGLRSRVGVPQSSWTQSKVKYIASYLNGYAFKPSDWSEAGLPIIRIQNLTGDDSTFNYYDGQIPGRFLVRAGDILLSWSASLGVFVWRGPDAWLNQHIFKVTPRHRLVSDDFYVWLARWLLQYMAREAHGSTMQHVTKGKFGALHVSLPSLDEQAEIADFLNGSGAQLDAAAKGIESEIDLLLEMRERLVADLVFGRVSAPSGFVDYARRSADELNGLLDAQAFVDEGVEEAEE